MHGFSSKSCAGCHADYLHYLQRVAEPAPEPTPSTFALLHRSSPFPVVSVALRRSSADTLAAKSLEDVPIVANEVPVDRAKDDNSVSFFAERRRTAEFREKRYRRPSVQLVHEDSWSTF